MKRKDCQSAALKKDGKKNSKEKKKKAREVVEKSP